MWNPVTFFQVSRFAPASLVSEGPVKCAKLKPVLNPYRIWAFSVKEEASNKNKKTYFDFIIRDLCSGVQNNNGKNTAFPNCLEAVYLLPEGFMIVFKQRDFHTFVPHAQQNAFLKRIAAFSFHNHSALIHERLATLGNIYPLETRPQP